MINVPQQNPRKAAAIVFGLGLATILIGRFLPGELATWHSVTDLIGTALGGVGAFQIVQAPTVKP